MNAVELPLSAPLLIRQLGCVDYLTVFEAMRGFTEARDASTHDELWFVEHFAVFTQGLNGKPDHVLAPGDIPVIPVDRGGQVTYHGPGQLVVYLLVDMRRLHLGVRRLITLMEQSVVDLLAICGIRGYARLDPPGVYVNGAKIASLGLRIRRGCSYHGLSVNVAMDLEPFARINPCGYPGMRVTQLRELGVLLALLEVRRLLLRTMIKNLGYTAIKTVDHLPKQPIPETGNA
jgi:lipoyl(octanoyl) transferase